MQGGRFIHESVYIYVYIGMNGAQVDPLKDLLSLNLDSDLDFV